jgi:hypothetical protein
MEQELDIKSFLEEHGYPVRDAGNEWSSKCLYRGGSNWNLSINKKTGFWFDFVQASGGPFSKLAEIIAGNKLEESQFAFSNTDFIDELKLPKKFDNSILDSLIKDNSYWKSRDINESIFDEFTCGIFNDGKMAKRACTIIYGQNKEIVGISGRALENWMKPKWKHLFKVSEVCFPLYLNLEIIKQKQEVILVESLGNLFSLWSAGIKNVICIFGTRLHGKVLTSLLSLNLKSIKICLDNDSLKNNVGNEAAEKIKVKLSNFFDENVVKIIFPPENDWNDRLVKLGGQSIVDLLG